MFFMMIFPGLMSAQGVQLFDQPGNYNFSVPAYEELIVEVWGAGGSGGGITEGSGTFAGQNGQNSYVYATETIAVGAGYGAPAGNFDTGGGGGLVTGGDELTTEDDVPLLTEDGLAFWVSENEDGSPGGGWGIGHGGAAGGIPSGGGGTRLAPTLNNTNGANGFPFGGGGAGGRSSSGNQRPGGGGGGYARKVFLAGQPGAPTPGSLFPSMSASVEPPVTEASKAVLVRMEP
jgi:hypothetical protein